MARHERTQFDLARDELMSHIHRCGVLKATTEHQSVWFGETMEYMAERYTELKPEDLKDLQQIGERFCQPVISNAPPVEESASDDSATEDSVTEGVSASDEMVGAA